MSVLALFRSRWREDIFFRLWAAVILSVTLASGINTVVTIKSLRMDAQVELTDHVESMANVLAQALARPLFDINALAISSVGEAVGLDPQVVRLTVTAPDGAVQVDSGSGKGADSQIVTAERKVDYVANGKTYGVGRIALSLSGAAIDQKLRWQMVQAGVSGLVLVLTITASLYWVGRQITRPFGDLQDALDRLTHGDTDITLSGRGREDQIGALSDAIDRFRSALQELHAAEQTSARVLVEKSSVVDRLNAIYNGSHDAIMLLTDKGFFDCNSRTLEMFGVPTLAEFIACHPSHLSPPLQPDGKESHSSASEKIEVAFQSGQNRFEWMHCKVDGTCFPAEVLLSAFDYDGRRVLQATVRDITERKRIEQELLELNTDLESRIALRTQEIRATVVKLAESQHKLQGIVDNALDAVVRVNSAGLIVGWNSQAQTIFGWSSHDALGRALHHTIIPPHHQEAHLRGMARYMATAQTSVIDRRIEITALHQSGREFPIELAITRVTLEDPTQFEFCAFIRDITQRQQAEEEIRRSLEKQRELNQLKTRFVSMASHEFRTPLATIMSSTELLTHYFDRLPLAERGAVLQSIAVAVKRMTTMLEDILTIGRAEAERAEFKPQRVDLDVLCRDLVLEAQPEDEAAGTVRKVVQLAITGEHVQGMLDEKLLRHIFGNLLSNAIKYSHDAGVIDFQVECGADAYTFRVSDHGIGIPEADLPKLFETFHRATNVGTIAGTGLGLAIVKRSVELHGGSIGVSSVLGQGTVFTVSLPRLAAAAPVL